jgi:hypothetical protein
MESTLTALDERDTKLSLSAAKYICKLLWPLGGPAHPFLGGCNSLALSIGHGMNILSGQLVPPLSGTC